MQRLLGKGTSTAPKVVTEDQFLKYDFSDVSIRGLDLDEVVKLIGKDKKRQGKDVQFALLKAIGRPVTGQVVPVGSIKAAIDTLLR